jgi:peptidyl-prolyl cis-trans isomerase D
MLQKIRELTGGVVATVIFIIVGVPFAFFGINYYFSPSGEVIAATVGDEQITLRQLQRSFESLRQRWNAAGNEAPRGDAETALRQQALDSLVERELLRQAGDRLGLRVGNDVLKSRIQQIQEFHGEQGFDRARYEQMLTTLGYTTTGFEAVVRDDLAVDQLQSALVDTQFVTEHETAALLRLSAEERDFRHAIVSGAAVEGSPAPSEEEMRRYYEPDSGRFVEPERVRIAWLELSLDAFRAAVRVDEAAVRAYFDEHRANYSLEEQRQVNQLLVPLPKDAQAGHVAAAGQKARELLAQLRAGRSMKELAEADTSEQPLEYTEFGFLTRGVLEGDVEEAAFSLAEGGFSEPVRSDFGVHLLQLVAVRSEATDSFEAVEDTVRQDYVDGEAQKEFFEQSDLLATLAFENPDTLEPAARQLNLPVQETDYFARESPPPGVPADPQVLAAVFSDEVLGGRNNSEPLELERDRLVVVRVIDHQPAAKRPFDEVRDEIAAAILTERAHDAARRTGEAVLAKLRSGATTDAVAEEFALQWQDAVAVNRQNAGVNQAVLRLAFAVPRPAPGQFAVDGVALGTGDYAVVAVSAVRDSEREPPAQVLKDSRRDLQQLAAVTAWNRLLADLKDRTEINVLRDTP